jgi:hypothetical protein
MSSSRHDRGASCIRAVGVLALAAFTLAWPALAVAQAPKARSHPSTQPAPGALADSRVRRGLSEYKKWQYTSAAADFEAALAIAPLPRTYFYLGRADDKRGDATAAVEAYSAFLAGPPRSMKAEVDLAARRVEVLRKLPGKLDVSSTPPGAEIRVDGGGGFPPTPTVIEVDPGKHTIRVSAANRIPEEREVTLPFGSEAAVDFNLQEASTSESAAPSPPAAPEAPLASATTPAAPPAPDGESPPRAMLHAVRTRHRPTIDGSIDEGEWREALPVAAFTQKAPFGGQAPTEKTTMRLLYDDAAVYVAFDCEQASSPVVALLARRDRPLETDSVSIALDSRSDGRSAFEFSVSAGGVLMDGIRFDDGRIAREWDAIWEARTRVYEHRWSAEFRIPLNALRFESVREQSWGFEARRYVSARQETDEWSYIPLDVAGEVSHYGRLEGLRDLGSDDALELLPFVLGQARYQEPDPAIVHKGWSLRPSAGLDFKLHLGSDFALDGTANPDFGQVEADQLILNLTTVELLFPEKRPFFLAGMDAFSTAVPIFYSRRIGHTPPAAPLSSDPKNLERLYDYPQPTQIYAGLKVAGDLHGGWTVAGLSALTGPNEVDVVVPSGARDPRLIDPLATYNVLRVRGQLAPALDLGVLGTATTRGEPGHGWPLPLTSRAGYPAVATPDGSAPTTQLCPGGEQTRIGERCFHDAYVGSADLVWRSPSREYVIRGQGFGSLIENGPTRILPDGTSIGSGDLGAGGALRFSKAGGEHWVLDGSVGARSRTLDFNDLGFMDRQNDATAAAYAEYRTLEPWHGLMETHTWALGYGTDNLNGLALERGLMLMENVVLANRWSLALGGYATAQHFDDREVGDGTALERDMLFGSLQAASTDPRRPLVLSAQTSEEWLPDGGNVGAQLGILWRPASMVELQILPTYSRNFGEPRYAGTGQSSTDLVFGRLHAESLGVTLRAGYTFTPTLTLQAYAQLFLATGHYFDYAHFAAPSSGPRPVVRLSALVPGSAPPVNPDFEQGSLAVNVVLRWEYHPGSILYLLYTRSQNPDVALNPSQVPRFDPSVVRDAPASNVFMVKLSYWIG